MSIEEVPDPDLSYYAEFTLTSDEMFALKPALEAEANRIKRANRLEKMHLLYGRCEGQQCGDCRHFVSVQYAKTYHKCRLYGMSHGPATDWLVRYTACGKFEHIKRTEP